MKNGKGKTHRNRVPHNGRTYADGTPRYGRTYKESLALKKMLDKLPEVHYRSWKEAFTPEEWVQLRKTRRASI